MYAFVLWYICIRFSLFKFKLSMHSLLLCSFVSLTKNIEVEQSFDEKCHHKIIYGFLCFNIPLSPHYYKDEWDFKKVKLNVLKKQASFEGSKAYCNQDFNGKCQILTENLINIFGNLIIHKIKRNWLQSSWMDG